MEPINYMAQMPQQNPLQDFNQGLQTISSIAQLQQLGQQQQQQAKSKEDLTAFFNKPNKTSDDYNLMMATYPNLKEVLSSSYKTATDEKKQNDFNIAAQISGALHNGNNDLAKNILTKEKEAYLNSGDTKSAGGLDNILNTIDANPKGALDMSNMFMASIYPDKFNEVYKGITETNIATKKAPLELEKLQGDISKISADIGLTKAQTSQAVANTKKAIAETGEIGLDTQKKLFELNALKEGGNMLPPDKKFEAEEKLRKEFTSRTSGFQESERVYSTINASASDKTGAGDIALVTSFMKMLDPGSVVRETEFATARDTSGLYDKLGNQLTKLQNGQFLSESQRQSFKKLAGDYMNASLEQKNRIKDSYSNVIKDYGLNSKNVFTAEKQEQSKKEEGKQVQNTQQVQPLTQSTIQQTNKPRIVTAQELVQMGGSWGMNK